MSYHQGSEGGAIPKERSKDGSPFEDLDETMDPDMSVHPERAESISSGCFSMKSNNSMNIPIHFKDGTLQQNEGPVEVPCDICSVVQAVKFCQTCSVSYCETHIRQHYTIAALQRHTVVDVTGDLVQKLCQHDYSPLEVFCRTDQMLICSQCAETNHKGHDMISHEIKQPGRQPKSFDGEQHTMLTSDEVLPPPGDIQILLLTLDSVSLSWRSPQGVKGPHKFKVTWECDGETSSSRVKDVYHLKISSLQPGEKYQFSVATEGEDGRQSRWVSASVTTVVPPRDLKVDHVKDTSFTLHWTKAEGMEKVPQRFLISYCRPGTDLHAENTKDCHTTFSNLQPGTEYTISVSTLLNNGEESEPVSTTICTILPAPDQLTVDSVDTTSAAVSWSQPPGLDQTQHHYQISYHCPGTEPHITTTSSHSITLSDLQGGTQYSVTVCTVLENGNQSQLVSTTLTTKHEVRIVLVGKTGVGKSASGNTILGRKVFPSKFSSVSLTKDCNKRKGKVDEQRVAVIDTPGLLYTTLSNEEGLKKIAQCISLSSPGPHVFLVVIKLGRFTEEEQRTVEMIQRFFGDEASKYTMVLFTHGDLLDYDVTIEDFLLENPHLESLLAKCNGGYHVFNNKDRNPSQVTELLEKINKMVMMNGGRYDTEMLKQAERKRSSCLVSLPCLFLFNAVEQATAQMRCFKRLCEGSSKTR